MMDFGKWAFANKRLVYFLVAVLLAGGAFSCYRMSKLEDPEIKLKIAMVVTVYPGARLAPEAAEYTQRRHNREQKEKKNWELRIYPAILNSQGANEPESQHRQANNGGENLVV